MAQSTFPLVPCSRPERFPSCSPLTRCSMSFLCTSSRFSGAGREKLVEIPQLHSSHSCLDKVVHTPVVCNDRRPDGSDVENCAGSAVAVRFERGRCSCYAGAVLVVLDVPVIMQRRRSLKQWSSPESVSSSPGLVDIPVRNRDRLLSAVECGILRHFSRSSGCPGVERQLYELSSAHTCECSRAPGVPESPEVTRQIDCAN